MKRIKYIFLAMLLAFLGGCTADSLDQSQNPETKDGYVTMHFTLDNMPYSELMTKAGGETSVGSLSLMTFDESGNFLGRVEATNIVQTNTNETDGSAQGTGTASVPKDTRIIHFIANYAWSGNEYVVPNGETETSLMPTLESNQHYVAWGRTTVSSLSALISSVTVNLTRNYAKVNVTSEASNFTVAGFALGNYVSKGKIVTYGESASGFDNVTSATNANTKISPVDDPETAMTNQLESDLNTTGQYMFEYANPSGNQSFVIVKNSSGKYFKIQFLDSDKKPYIIERNYIYKVVIKKFDSSVSGSSSFADALKAVPSNNIYAEVLKESTTISDGTNTLTVTPLFHILTTTGSSYTGTITFSANYWAGSTLKNGSISISKGNDAHNYLASVPSTSNGTVSVSVNVPGSISKLDSAMVIVNAGVLSRTVTIYISKQYSFEPATGFAYSAVGDQGILKFNIPSDFPASLYPIKCKIKAEDLNPVNGNGQPQMFLQQENGSYYYIYEATTSGLKSLTFKTTRKTVTDPTIENDYFAKGTFEMTSNIPEFSNLSVGPAYYDTGSTFNLNFNMTTAGTVTISGYGINTKTYTASAGANTVPLTTNMMNAQGNITISAPGYTDATVAYSNNSTLQHNYTATGSLQYYYYYLGWLGSYYDVPRNSKLTAKNGAVSYTSSVKNAGQYSIVIQSGASVSDDVDISVIVNKTTYNTTASVSDLLNGSALSCN